MPPPCPPPSPTPVSDGTINYLVVRNRRFSRTLALRLDDVVRVVSRWWRRPDSTVVGPSTKHAGGGGCRPGIGRRGRRTRKPARRSGHGQVQRRVAPGPRAPGAAERRRGTGGGCPERSGGRRTVHTGSYMRQRRRRTDSIHDMTPLPVFFGNYSQQMSYN